MPESQDLVERLKSGDESAFKALVTRHHASLIRVAQGFVRSRATAEEVAQDTWLALIEGIDAFDRRSSLKNWMFAILANKARTRAVRDARIVTGLETAWVTEDAEAAVDPLRFDGSGRWTVPPEPWDELTPERIVGGRELWSHVSEAIDALPSGQKAVLVLRDIEHLGSSDVAAILGVSSANQRVLLHRARARLRTFLERLLAEPQQDRLRTGRRKNP